MIVVYTVPIGPSSSPRERPLRGEANFGFVPFADDDNLEDLTLVATNWKAKAAVQIAGSISSNWRTPVQRKLTFSDIPHLGDIHNATRPSESERNRRSRTHGSKNAHLSATLEPLAIAIFNLHSF